MPTYDTCSFIALSFYRFIVLSKTPSKPPDDGTGVPLPAYGL